MIRVERIHISPVKALGLTELPRAHLDKPGIAGDRAFYVVDASGKLVTQREHGALVQIHARYDVADSILELTFPDGSCVSGVPELGESVSTMFFGVNAVEGRLVSDGWSQALSEFAGRALRLVKTSVAGRGFDAFPLSMCSLASQAAFSEAAARPGDDGRRFRQNIHVSGCGPHEEDTWIGGKVCVGNAVLRVKMADSRCVVTTLSPDTGAADVDTLKIIAGYRGDQPNEVNFGVYCTVVEPGEVRVGDEVVPV